MRNKMDKNKETQICDNLDAMTYHLTTSLGEVVEVLGQISESLDRLSTIVHNVDDISESLSEMGKKI